MIYKEGERVTIISPGIVTNSGEPLPPDTHLVLKKRLRKVYSYDFEAETIEENPRPTRLFVWDFEYTDPFASLEKAKAREDAAATERARQEWLIEVAEARADHEKLLNILDNFGIMLDMRDTMSYAPDDIIRDEGGTPLNWVLINGVGFTFCRNADVPYARSQYGIGVRVRWTDDILDDESNTWVYTSGKFVCGDYGDPQKVRLLELIQHVKSQARVRANANN